MRTLDHKILAVYLTQTLNGFDNGIQRTMFRLGCVCPDYLPFTRLYGFCRNWAPNGHNYDIRKQKIFTSILQLSGQTHWSFWQYIRLGIVNHYLMDAFTFTHNSCFTGTIAEHKEYEERLHQYLQIRISDADTVGTIRSGDKSPEELVSFLKQLHRQYMNEKKGVRTDCEYILYVSKYTTKQLLAYRESVSFPF
ncbi:MAG: zinc dependent phospholipase C family protein [Lachnospiraceae bacterium]